ncbi:MAG: histidine kinase [Bacteroidales bacterium]|nr:histidine kinase [Bacteroidales bacterium]
MLKLINIKIKISNILSSIWFIALIIALSIFIFTSDNFKEFSVKLLSEEGKYYDDYRFFYDINNDSIDENVDITYFDLVKSMGLSINNDKGKILHTSLMTPFNFPEYFTEPYLTPPDEDSIKNLLYIIERNDEIYLGTNRLDTLIEQIFLDTIYSAGEYKGVPKAYDYGYFGLFDVNNDEKKELYLYIAEGYRVFPRKLYCVDYKNNKVIKKSANFGAFPVNYKMYSIDNEPYFVVGSQATTNMTEFQDFYLCDTASYFLVFDKNLELKFDPVYMGSNASRVYFFLQKINNQYFFFVLANPYDEAKKANLKKIDLKGNIIDEYKLQDFMKATFDGIFSIENNIFYINSNFEYKKFNTISNTETFVKLKFAEKPFWLISFDIDKDGNNEHLFRDKSSNKIYVTRSNFKKPTQIILPLDEIDRARFYFPQKKDDKNIIFVWTYSAFYTFEYIKDKWYILKLLGFITLLFVGAYLFVFTIQAILKYRLKQRQKITTRIKELEFINVRNQMNPHFTLNTLNFISTSILKNEKEKAYDVISGFSNIIRSTLLDSNKILRTLNEELKFVDDYLKIQKARFFGKFDYFIDIKKNDIKNIKLPPFIIQIFVENSLKHGLKTVKSGGKIIIDVIDNEKNADIYIKDNGIGRKAAKNLSAPSTGKGLSLTKEYIDLINSLNKEKISLEFIDSFEGDVSKGFTVKITVPKNLKQSEKG